MAQKKSIPGARGKIATSTPAKPIARDLVAKRAVKGGAVLKTNATSKLGDAGPLGIAGDVLEGTGV